MVNILNNAVVNPFHHDRKTEEPDELVKDHSPSRYGSTDTNEANKHANVDEDSASDTSRPTSEYQNGLQKAEAVALVWSKWSLIGTYIGCVPPIRL